MPDEIVPAPAPAAPPPPAAPPAVPTAAVLPVVPATTAPAPAPAAPATPAAVAASSAQAETPDPASEMASRIRSLELRTVLAETGLKASLAKYITANDEAGMKAQAEELKTELGAAATTAAPAASGETPAPAAAPPAPAAGSITNPPAPKEATIDERIAAAEKAGKVGLSIQLKREKAGMRL